MRDAETICHFSIRQTASSWFVRDLLGGAQCGGLARYAASVPKFLCNATQSFGKEWETVGVRTKTKTMKAIENIVSDLS